MKIDTRDEPKGKIPEDAINGPASASLRTDFVDEPIKLEDVPAEQTFPNTPAEMPRNALDGQSTKLDVFFKDPDFFSKWHPHWFNETGPRIHFAEQSGYVMVDKDEIVGNMNEPTPSNNDVGTMVRRYVGSTERGQPMYSYLMKKPIHIHEYHRREYDKRVDQIANAVMAGAADRSHGDGRYTADSIKQPTGLPRIAYDVQSFRQRPSNQ